MNFLFNQQIFNIVHNIAGKSRILDFLGIFLAQYFPYFLVLFFLYILITRKGLVAKYNIFLFVILSLLISRGIFTEIIRYFLPIDRPFAVLGFNPLISHESSFAFPSGHAAFYFALAFSVFIFNRKQGIFFIIAATIISFARVFVGVHWPLDIVGGFFVALAGTVISYLLLKSIIKKPDTSNSSVSEKLTNFSISK